MALEVSIFVLLLTISVGCYLLGLFSKTHFLFLFGCVLILACGASLFAFDGLITGHYYDVDGGIASVVVSMSNVSLWVLALFLVALGVISTLVFDFQVPVRKISPFHY
jgi:hypothetical protein